MSSSNARRVDEWTRVGSGEEQSERREVVSAYAQRPKKPTDSATAGTIGLLLYGLFGCRLCSSSSEVTVEHGSALCDVHSVRKSDLCDYDRTPNGCAMWSGQGDQSKFRGKHRDTYLIFKAMTIMLCLIDFESQLTWQVIVSQCQHAMSLQRLLSNSEKLETDNHCHSSRDTDHLVAVEVVKILLDNHLGV